MRVVFLTEGLSHSGDGPGECGGGSPMVGCPVLTLHLQLFWLFSCVHPGPHQMLLCWWHGKLPHHLFLLGGLHQPGPCGALHADVPPFKKKKKIKKLAMTMPIYLSLSYREIQTGTTAAASAQHSL